VERPARFRSRDGGGDRRCRRLPHGNAGGDDEWGDPPSRRGASPGRRRRARVRDVRRAGGGRFRRRRQPGGPCPVPSGARPLAGGSRGGRAIHGGAPGLAEDPNRSRRGVPQGRSVRRGGSDPLSCGRHHRDDGPRGHSGRHARPSAGGPRPATGRRGSGPDRRRVPQSRPRARAGGPLRDLRGGWSRPDPRGDRREARALPQPPATGRAA